MGRVCIYSISMSTTFIKCCIRGDNKKITCKSSVYEYTILSPTHSHLLQKRSHFNKNFHFSKSVTLESFKRFFLFPASVYFTWSKFLFFFCRVSFLLFFFCNACALINELLLGFPPECWLRLASPFGM